MSVLVNSKVSRTFFTHAITSFYSLQDGGTFTLLRSRNTKVFKKISQRTQLTSDEGLMRTANWILSICGTEKLKLVILISSMWLRQNQSISTITFSGKFLLKLSNAVNMVTQMLKKYITTSKIISAALESNGAHKFTGNVCSDILTIFHYLLQTSRQNCMRW